MLVQVVFLVFAFFAMLGLIVDVGYARLTQSRMQTAADSAALEGLRKRDVGVLNPTTGQTVNDPYAGDCIRRAAANRLAHWTFDDDFSVADGDAEYQFGAGPVIDMTDGSTNLHAGALMGVPAVHVYKPDLQLNQGNQFYGDMVSGRFCYNPDPIPSEGLAFSDPAGVVCTELQNGSGVYARNDFNPNGATPTPPPILQGCPEAFDDPPTPWPLGGSGSLDTVDDSAFLVRLRRSNELREYADQTEPTVASAGPSLPLTFSRGTTLFGDNDLGGYSPRRDGLSVRATSIAHVRPALQVGLRQAAAGVPGVTPYALLDTFVRVLNAVGCPVTVTPSTGVITSRAGGAATCPAAGQVVGRFIDDPGAPVLARQRAVGTVGRTLPAAVASASACAAFTTGNPAAALNGYGPVYSTMASGAVRIIGFSRLGLGQITCPVVPPAPGVAATFPATIQRGVPLVAPGNASAVLSGGLPLPVTVGANEVRELLAKNCPPVAYAPACVAVAGVAGVGDYAPVLVPALAR